MMSTICSAGSLNHPNIVTIYDVGRVNDVVYMAMEFIEGVELRSMVAEGRPLPVTQAISIAAQVAEGLAHAHDHGVVHRDIKPANIMVVQQGPVKITDFGIARLPNSAVKTMTGLILGSPRYMSPEQVIGKTIDARSDIFSLGVVLYEALTGVAPFDGDNVNAIMYATVNTTPPAPSQHNRNVTAMLDLIVAKAMAKLLEDRYQTVKEFADDLREVRRQVDSSRPATALKARSAPVMPANPAPIVERHVDTATMPLNVGGNKEEEDTKAVPLNKTFDSFDATLRLAAMTDQTEDFREYISETQKMRAYRGKIEATSPLAASKELKKQVEANQQQPEQRRPTASQPSRARPQPMQLPERVPVGQPAAASNLIAIAAIVVLSIAAVALVIALVVK